MFNEQIYANMQLHFCVPYNTWAYNNGKYTTIQMQSSHRKFDTKMNILISLRTKNATFFSCAFFLRFCAPKRITSGSQSYFSGFHNSGMKETTEKAVFLVAFVLLARKYYWSWRFTKVIALCWTNLATYGTAPKQPSVWPCRASNNAITHILEDLYHNQ